MENQSVFQTKASEPTRPPPSNHPTIIESGFRKRKVVDGGWGGGAEIALVHKDQTKKVWFCPQRSEETIELTHIEF